MNRYDIINLLGKNKETYLEIGVQDGICFSKVNIKNKWGIDPKARIEVDFPVTSDVYFSDFAKDMPLFDVIFIDGLHLYEQVLKDFYNSLKYLNDGGVIIIHDCNPLEEKHQSRDVVGGTWNGDVWRAFHILRCRHADFKMYTVDADHGCGIITAGNQDVLNLPEDISYEDFAINRERILNLISVEDFKGMVC